MSTYTFLTLNDFAFDGGATIRMYGIINGLAEEGHKIHLISNATSFTSFHSTIEHSYLALKISKNQKRNIQLLAGITPWHFFRLIMYKFIKRLRNSTNQVLLTGSEVISFEYLDNTIAYILKHMKVIKSYTNDLHGIVPEEFKYKSRYATSRTQKIAYLARQIASASLDKKVFRHCSGLIYASKEMEEYFIIKYPYLAHLKSEIIPYFIEPIRIEKKMGTEVRYGKRPLVDLLKNKTVITFAGSFKKLGGVPDLVKAFIKISKKNNDAVLMLIGDGETLEECKEIVQQNGLQSKVLFVGRIQYKSLQQYFDLTHIIVCPDRFNRFSDLILHAKYYDAFYSGKIVILGNFKVVKELNSTHLHSLVYNLEQKDSLSDTIQSALDNKYELLPAFRQNKIRIENQYNYAYYFKHNNL